MATFQNIVTIEARLPYENVFPENRLSARRHSQLTPGCGRPDPVWRGRSNRLGQIRTVRFVSLLRIGCSAFALPSES